MGNNQVIWRHKLLMMCLAQGLAVCAQHTDVTPMLLLVRLRGWWVSSFCMVNIYNLQGRLAHIGKRQTGAM